MNNILSLIRKAQFSKKTYLYPALSFLMYIAFFFLFIFVINIWDYGGEEIAGYTPFHFPSFFLNIVFGLVVLGNVICIVYSFLIFLSFLFFPPKIKAKEYIKRLLLNVYPMLIISWSFGWSLERIWSYFKSPFWCFSVQFQWLLESL